MVKLAVIIGATGNQGGSVAQRFLADPAYQVRALTRNPSSAAALSLQSQGAEVVKADLDDLASLKTALAGANFIFGVTNYWEPFFRPDCRAEADRTGISYRQFAGDVERRQGINIADAAAATVDSLDVNGFVASTLSHAAESSGGRLKELYHFDAKADVFPRYVVENHPLLAQKMSYVQTGYFMTSYKIAPEHYLKKMPDGVWQMSFATAPDKRVPHLNVQADIGNFVYAVSKLEPGKSYMVAGTECSWTDYIRLWGRVTGQPARYKQVTLDDMVEMAPDKDFGREIGDMFLYSSDPGYDGGDKTLLRAADIEKLGVQCPMTGLEAWMSEEDWSSYMAISGN